MARKDTLRVAVSRPLQENIGLPGQTDEVDYFALFRLEPGRITEIAVDEALLERSKTLREWQSSPQYGQEVVGLLRTLQRVAKILKDPKRREAYWKELERARSGRGASAIEEFTDLVRAALGDGSISGKARSELTLYATAKGISPADAQQIISRVRKELKAQKEAEPESQAPQWEFSLAEQGEEAYFLMLQSIENSGKFNEETPTHMLNQAGKYGIPVDRAGAILQDFQRMRFRRMVERVAMGGVVSDAQSRMLLAKASSYGLDSKQAYEQIADFTLAAYDTDEMLKNLKLQETFTADDIKEIVGTKATQINRRKRMIDDSLMSMLRNVVLIFVLGGAIIGAGWYFKSRDAGDAEAGPSGGSVAGAAATPGGGASPAGGGATPAEGQNQADGAAGNGSAAGMQRLVSLQDPANGLLRFVPEQPGDPALFDIMIHETTCLQYQAFLRATLESAPQGWGADYSYPQGWAYRPVVNVTPAMAENFCQWVAREQGLAPGSVRLPTQAEFTRAARGRTLRGEPTSPGFWARAQLGSASGSEAIKQNRWDKIFIQNLGQMYDLVGNVAEWGSEEQAGRRALLGGDYEQKGADFNPFTTRWEAPQTARATIGFRIVIQQPAG